MQQTTRAIPAAMTASAQGAGASGVRAGLQIEVERVAARQRAGLFHGQDLGVLSNT